MTTAAAPTLVSGLGSDTRIYDVVFVDNNTTTGAIAHGLPFSPTMAILTPTVATATYANVGVTTTATTFTVAQSTTSLAGSWRLTLGRFPNPVVER